ncbi:MAG: bifunctional homocysteine S-methyltransferase/methylenetetrahydrofolate reductase [Calditrichaeota bacterium]|nr:MAG: bifunctional homocysteine S-methyltransferase/methylenetetrahydrofolate reductase [Calditrichota bacterium]
MKTSFLDYLQENIIIGDGALGTLLYGKGIPMTHSFDELNISRPALIKETISEYVRAGAQAVETNTFTANRHKLNRFELGHRVEEINVRGVDIARAATQGEAYVLASVGPVRAGEIDEITDDEVKAIFAEQIGTLDSAQPDAIILETFARASELEIALATALQITKLPVIAQISVDETGATRDGQHIVPVFKKLRKMGANVVGINCAKGPSAILHALEQVPLSKGLLLSAYPNAGLPAYVDGRYLYLSTPDYFGDTAWRLRDQGVRLIGGCCGTTPEHIQAMAKALDGMQPVKRKSVLVKASRSGIPEKIIDSRPGVLDYVKERPTFIVELDPPRGLNYQKIVAGAEALKLAGADAITMADSSLGVTRMSNLALGHIVQQETGLMPLIHLACRDRNLIGTQAMLMGLHAFNINYVLAITGDPAKVGDQPGATSVYDLNSFNLVRMIKQMNKGIAFSGRRMDQATDFKVGVAFNPNSQRMDAQVRRLEKKVQFGADYVMTQPIYDPKQAKMLADIAANFDIPFFIGIMPLVNQRNAEFLHHEVPGITIPDFALNRMKGLEKEAGQVEGIKIAAELQNEILSYFKGIYLITPFVRYEMTTELIELARAV